MISNNRKGCQIKHMLSTFEAEKQALSQKNAHKKKVYYDCISLKIENKIESKLNSNYFMLIHIIFLFKSSLYWK